MLITVYCHEMLLPHLLLVQARGARWRPVAYTETGHVSSACTRYDLRCQKVD